MCAKKKLVLVRVDIYFTDFGACPERQLHDYQFAYAEITFPLIWLHFQPTDKKVSNRIWEEDQQDAHFSLIIHIN